MVWDRFEALRKAFALFVPLLSLPLGACGDQTTISAWSDGASLERTKGRSCLTPGDTLVRVPGGTFLMGQEGVYDEEGPVRETSVRGFWMDPHEVTNRQFAAFVHETGYKTIAELPVDPSIFGRSANKIPSEMLLPGSAVFVPPEVPSSHYGDWWTYMPGASWKKPFGPEGPDAADDVPVVHLAFADMLAYAKWREGRIPTEAEWEYAARAGAQTSSDQPLQANTWHGLFPLENRGVDGFKNIAPVGCYEPNSYGLYDMVGNVWEMTSDLYAPGHDLTASDNPTGPTERSAFDPQSPQVPTRVIKGGSYLCAPNYCRRYRPAARSGRDTGLGTSNVGFRLVYDQQPAENR